MTLALLLLLATVPRYDTACETCAVIELNSFYDDHGCLMFRQVIFWDARVRAWRMAPQPQHQPVRDWQRGGWYVEFNDSGASGNILRRIHAACARYSWTQHDPELLDRCRLPKEQRRELKPFRR